MCHIEYPLINLLSTYVQGIHGDELPYVFGSPLVDGLSPFPSSYTSAEKMMSEAVMTYWTNFAKSGYVCCMSVNCASVKGGQEWVRLLSVNWLCDSWPRVGTSVVS